MTIKVGDKFVSKKRDMQFSETITITKVTGQDDNDYVYFKFGNKNDCAKVKWLHAWFTLLRE